MCRLASRCFGFIAIRSRERPVSMPARRSFSRLAYRLSKERLLSSHPNLRRLLLGVASHSTPLAGLSARASYPGFRPSSRHHETASYLSSTHPKRRSLVPSSGVRSLSTVFSAIPLAGLFHPAAVFRTHPVQGLHSLRAAVFSRRKPTAPMPLSPPCSPVARSPQKRRLGFEALLHAKVRSKTAAV